MKKKITITAIIFLVICIYVAARIIAVPDGEKFTDKIENYNTEEYDVPLFVFPAEIPSNAQVISFCYYDYWYEEKDIYLELKFSTAEEMESYLNKVKSDYVSMCQAKLAPRNGEWFIETQNIYNHSYTDMFCTALEISQDGKHYIGYEIEPRGDCTLYSCNFMVISYSYDELTVIHASVRGSYLSNVNKHLPEYFTRFDVPCQEHHQRRFYLD